ncbi:S locus-related glycoprotein 1 binding pollen coat protein [Vigna unguiculata]|uniref:S locus-related glycoprotein 1 binding pollen coat protein n=1 Tax=Vigna unguiculata TaxID=3917 RepID=A0A4D6MRD2_VIGUN|nr:S locus-related glycoprotein 1 binding pollen coat protein [Vigna unguiculata]
MVAKMSFTHYFCLFLIISGISMRRVVVGEDTVCEKPELTDRCGFVECPQVCMDLYKEKYAAGECIAGLSNHLQCVCFYHCSPTQSNTTLTNIPN